MTDTTDAKNVILNFMTCEKPEVTENIILIGTLAKAVFTGAEFLAIDTLPVTDARLKTAWDHELYRIRLTMTAGEFKLEIE